MAEFIWSMAISFQLLFIIISGVIYMYLKANSFKYYALYNIFLVVYVLSRLDANYNSVVDLFSSVMGKHSAEVLMEILCLYIQICFYHFYTIFALHFLDLDKHTKRFFPGVIKVLKTLLISFFITGVFCYFIGNDRLYLDLFAFVYIPVMLTVFLPSVYWAVKLSGPHKVFFLIGASLFVACALIAFVGSNVSSLNMSDPILFFYVGIILETIFFSIGLAYKIKIFNDERNKIRAEITKHKHRQQLSRFQGLLQGEEKERKRMAEELHDGIAGDLTAIKFQLARFNMKIANPINAEIINEVNQIIDKSYEQIREISHNLSPSSIINYGLILALENFCEKIEKHYGNNFKFTYYGDKLTLSKTVQTHIYRIVQELITNMVKHAEATEGSLYMDYQKPHLKMVVKDNGKGFSNKDISPGIGLSNIDSRIRFLNAKLMKENSKSGTVFVIEINTNLVPNNHD